MSDPQAGPGTDLPEAAGRRLADRAFSSGLSAVDFASCLELGLRPVGLVQGFCVMQWSWYGVGSPYRYGVWNPGAAGGYSRSYPCPHGFVSAEHRRFGANFEQTWVEQAWSTGFATAYRRMVEEAATAGAHGVVGVVDTLSPLADMGVNEFHLLGTAVVVEGAPPPPGGTWTTYLAGQRLTKLIESGLMPVAIAAAMSSVRLWASCMTEYELSTSNVLMAQPMGTWQGEVEQLAEGQMAARRLAREHVAAQLGGDALYGAALTTGDQEVGEGDWEIQCELRGNRVRRFAPPLELDPPRPTVRLR